MKEKLKNYFCQKEIDFALLFGSFAKNKAHHLSDVDIGAYFLKEPDILDIGEMVLDLEEITGKRVDLVVLNDLYKKNPLLSFNIVQNHETLCVKDENKYVDFKANSYLWYFDHEPLFAMQKVAFEQRVKNGDLAKTYKIGRKYKNSL
ncbi:type VII toxin-antitoxin system MntA family adenylyltransferase antitoxin [Nitratiruptor sp. SB155-2]|uniref:type VII toxin-antitoxin system MntA family adenylyltransferase antitoxin n=1 Tax=Nitratiruptor sp. (strain SB155-2) TaxID=387092 RepID=UPI000158728A|nr:nucleotidyltransferase domain-containing protein [Nitratiruptor sp. SB155-2]BAF70683.1 nucleotidyltransferase [Nitratiruptor sp. SB155-2]